MIGKMIADLLFPRKCLFCRKLLGKTEQILCTHCKEQQPLITKYSPKIPYVAKWVALWYYEEGARESLLRYKFGKRRSYCQGYGKILAPWLKDQHLQYDLITWVPVSHRRRMERGFDQVELVTHVLCKQLEQSPVPCLKKIRHTQTQSTLTDASQRRANVLGAYKVLNPEQIAGKRILLLDDIITTGSTLSECAKVLLTAGAKEVYGAAIAAARQHK